jgi:hypothetical protein
MRTGTRLIAAAGAGLLVAGGATSMLVAARPADSLPPDKQALEDFAVRHQANAPRADKRKDPGRPLVVQTDPPPEAGLLGVVGAPVPGGVFTPTNAWAGWTTPTTFVQVYAGDSPERPGQGLVFVVRRTGRNGHLDPTVAPVTRFVPAPGAGGPLRIDRVSGTDLILVNRGGHEFVFHPASAAFR